MTIYEDVLLESVICGSDDNCWNVSLNQLPDKIITLNQLQDFGKSPIFNDKDLKLKLNGNSLD